MRCPAINGNKSYLCKGRETGDILMEVFASSSVRNLVNSYWIMIGLPFITCIGNHGASHTDYHTDAGYRLSVHRHTRASNRISMAPHFLMLYSALGAMRARRTKTMKEFSYSPFDSCVSVGIICPKCKGHFKTEPLAIPEADLSAETGNLSVNAEENAISCPFCGHSFSIQLATSYNGGIGIIHGLDEKDIDNIEITQLPDA